MKVEVPIGFRFRPTDEELIVHYLRRKVFSLPLPASVVRAALDVFHIHPEHLPGDLREKRYFFSKNNNGDLGGGHWKVNAKIGAKVISGNGGSNQAVGLKRCLVYYQGKKKTNWIMHEFRLILASHHSTLQECTTLVQVGDWVLCRIYQKKNTTKAKMVKKTTQHSVTNNINDVKGPTVSSVDDLTMMDVIDDGTNGLGSPPQDCSSSGITEVSCNEFNDEEACSTSSLLY